MADAEARCEALSLSHPQAARLALLCCLPVRVAPALVRMVRLRLLPQASTGDEADLWLSDLVDTRSSGGFAFESSVRSHLREQLAAQPALLDELWHRVHVEHGAWLSARARLEEELTWRLLRAPADPWVDQQWQAVIDEIDQSDAPEGLARWVVRAMTDLPAGSRLHAAGQRAWYGAHLLLGDARVLGEEVQQFLDTQALSFALRRLPKRTVHVARTEQGVLISPLLPIENGFLVEVPATQPSWLQIEPNAHGASFEPMAFLLPDHEYLHVPIQAQTVHLRWLDGSVQALGPKQDTEKPFAARNHPPRVRLTYDVEFDGAIRQVELPFVIGVLADLSGKPVEPLPAVADRKFLEIDADNFDARMQAIQPRVAFWIDSTAGAETGTLVDLTFTSMDNFRPDQFALQVAPLREQVLKRTGLANLLSYLVDKAEAKAWLEQALREQASNSGSVKTASVLRAQWGAQLMRFGNHDSPDALARILDSTLQTLVALTAAHPMADEHDLVLHVQSLIALIDGQLHQPLNNILHHPEFQKLESAWRGLHYLVHNTETSEQLKIRVLNIRKDELAEALLLDDMAHWDQSPLYKKVYEEEYGMFGGEPFGCLVGDFEFDHSPEDVAVLSCLAKVAAAAHTVFLSNAKPSLLQMDSWQELAHHPRDLLKITHMQEYAAWQGLRASPYARYLGLCLPRMLARLPFSARTNPIEAFDFEESTGAENSQPLCWAGSAYGMATNMARSFKYYGWLARIRGIESGGVVENLPTWSAPTDAGEISLTCPIEIAISDRREAEFSKSGLLSLVHRKNSDFAVFIGGSSLCRPTEFDDPDLTFNEALYARLPYLLAANRFAQYLQCMVRDKVGSFHAASLISEYLNPWLAQYVDGDPANSADATRAMHPLAFARVVVQEQNPSEHLYRAELEIIPHHHLEGLSHPLRISMQFPSGTFS
jgi:type VI secretion system protein ImpC